MVRSDAPLSTAPFALVTASAAVHALVLLALSPLLQLGDPQRAPQERLQLVNARELLPEEPKPQEPVKKQKVREPAQPDPDKAAEPSPRQPPAASRKPAEGTPEPQPKPSKPAPAPVRFEETTLSNRSSGMRVSPSREGASDGLQSDDAHDDGSPRGTQQHGSPASQRSEPVPVDELGGRPEAPPELDRLLQKFYPDSARNAGIKGQARVRILIRPDGRSRVLKLLSASRPDFGKACRRMLRAAGAWAPGRDMRGQAVSTVVTFRCDFRVER
jgi:TonB family protein